MPKHAIEKLADKAEELQKEIKTKNKNKALARQIIAGARENADYCCNDDRWSMNWFVTYIKELENRLL